MPWMDYFKPLIRHFVAVQLRHKVRRHTAAALSRLDDRLLADVGVPRHRIAEYACEVAQISVPVPPMPTSARKGILAQLRSSRKRRTAIRDLSTLDDRLLRDIGIERGQIDNVVDATLSHRRDPGAAQPVIQLTEAMQQIFVPARQRPEVPAASVSASRSPVDRTSRATISVERTPDVHALQAQAANESQPLERRYRSAADT